MKERTVLYSRMLLFVLAFLGILLEMVKYGVGMLTYYTILSNILVLVFTGWLIFLMRKDDSIWTSQRVLRLKAGVTMAIMITCVIYHLLLAPLAEDFWRLENILCHYVVPLLFFFDTLIWDRQQQYRWFDPIAWSATPLIYCVFAIFNGLILRIPVPGSKESPFPYFFVNVTKFGWTYVGRMILIICIVYILSGYLLYLVKMLPLGKKSRR